MFTCEMKTQFSIEVQLYLDMCQRTTGQALRSTPQLSWSKCESILSGDTQDVSQGDQGDSQGGLLDRLSDWQAGGATAASSDASADSYADSYADSSASSSAASSAAASSSGASADSSADASADASADSSRGGSSASASASASAYDSGGGDKGDKVDKRQKDKADKEQQKSPPPPGKAPSLTDLIKAELPPPESEKAPSKVRPLPVLTDWLRHCSCEHNFAIAARV